MGKKNHNKQTYLPTRFKPYPTQGLKPGNAVVILHFFCHHAFKSRKNIAYNI